MSKGKIVQETIHLPSLEGNLFSDSPHREVHIYLPPSYDINLHQRYPVFFLLHGYTANHQSWVRDDDPDQNIIELMDIWLKEKKQSLNQKEKYPTELHTFSHLLTIL